MTASTNLSAVEKIRRLLDEKDLDGILLRTRRNFSWVTGGKDNHIVHTDPMGVASLVIFKDEKYCVATKMESARIHDEELLNQSYTFITPEWFEGEENAIIELCNGKRMGADVSFYDFLDISQEIARLRYTLNEAEIQKYRWLSQTAARAIESTCRELKPGWTEHEIAAHLAAKVMKEGINPHVLLVATDERIFKYRHPIPTDKKLERYAMLVICAEKWGLVSNVTRFVHFGALPKDLKENKEKLVQIDIAMNHATRPGAAIADVLQTGIDTYAEVGYGEDWRFLHQGGPTGYAPREFLAVPGVAGIVHENQAFAWNPAIRGIKSEDTIIVRANGNEFLTHTGEWVYMVREFEGVTYLRPDILVR